MEMIVLDHSKINCQFREAEKAQFIVIVLLYTFPRDSILEMLEVLVVRDQRKREPQFM